MQKWKIDVSLLTEYNRPPDSHSSILSIDQQLLNLASGPKKTWIGLHKNVGGCVE